MIFPFPLHSGLTAAYTYGTSLSQPKNLFVTWSRLLQNSTIDPADQNNPAMIYVETVDSATYYLQFLKERPGEFIAVQGIDSSSWYEIQFNISDANALQFQKSNELLQIQMSTLSSIDSEAIVYDNNPSFSYIYLDSTPTQGMGLDVIYDTVLSSAYLDLKQNISLDTTVNLQSTSYDDVLRLTYILSDNSFSFVNYNDTHSCVSEAKSEIPKINKLQAGELISCQIDSQTNHLTAIVSGAALQRENIIRLKVGIQNPKRVVPACDVEVRLGRQYQPQILSYGRKASALKTNSIDVKAQKILLGWGINPGDHTLPFEVKIVRGDASLSYFPYNSIILSFQLNQNTPPGMELSLNLNLKAESGAYVLPGSISENLDPAPGKKVVCQELYQSDQLKRKISCSGVGQLLSAQTYQLSFKM